jgi:hypothetical protein
MMRVMPESRAARHQLYASPFPAGGGHEPLSVVLGAQPMKRIRMPLTPSWFRRRGLRTLGFDPSRISDPNERWRQVKRAWMRQWLRSVRVLLIALAMIALLFVVLWLLAPNTIVNGN